jgi:phosphoglycolate phosphatase
MIGDNLVDLQMGRAAGVGLVIGVLSGLASAAELGPLADIVLASIDDLVQDAQGGQGEAPGGKAPLRKK